MINELTKEQEAKFPEYVDKWLRIGLGTYKEGDEKKAEEAIKLCYQWAKLKAPSEVYWADSPKSGLELAAKITGIKDKQTLVSQAAFGSQDAGWLSGYDFFKRECGIKECEELDGLMAIAECCGWYWPYDKAVILTRRPLEIHMQNKRLHRDMGPAVLYKDGFAVYSLNGITIDEKFILTPASEIPVADVMRINNVDARREVLRKIGLERFCKETNAKTIDTMTLETPVQTWPANLRTAYINKTGKSPNINVKKSVEYKLLDLDLGDGVTARVLQMENPSIDAIHVEGVEESCKTVKEALAWRLSLDSYTELSALS